MVTGEPGAVRGEETDTVTGPGTPLTSQRRSWRHRFSCVMSSSGMSACICHSHESSTVKASALPAP
jgi:hypothetical protein